MCPNPLMNIQEVKSRLLEVVKLYVHIGLNRYLRKINTRVPTSSYELSTLNSAFNFILEGHIGISCIKFLSHSTSLPAAANASNSNSIVEPVMNVFFLEAYEMPHPSSRNTHPLIEDESST
ncbi:hypothetical protein Tco_1331164 [Tanacetum coccineum]